MLPQYLGYSAESNNFLSHDKVLSFCPDGCRKSIPKFRRYLQFDVSSVFNAARNLPPIEGHEIPPKFR
jgi:hypothetical protein